MAGRHTVSVAYTLSVVTSISMLRQESKKPGRVFERQGVWMNRRGVQEEEKGQAAERLQGAKHALSLTPWNEGLDF